MAELQICLLGSFEVCRDFAPLGHHVWQCPWAANLLKLVLIRRPDPVPATEALRLLGPGRTLEELPAAVEAVNQVLQPQAALVLDGPQSRDGDGHPRLDQSSLRFAPSPQCWIDVDAMRSHYEAGVKAASRGDMFPAILAFQEADALYQGDLLEELQAPWLVEPRRRLRQLYTEILERLAEGHAVLARYQDAVGFCHKALAHEPLRESTYQRMMVYYYYMGDMAGAEEAYRACQEALTGAGRQVSEETVALWDQLRRRELPANPGASAAAAMEASKKNGKTDAARRKDG